MAELKTARTEADVDGFLATIEDERRRDDARLVCELLTTVTGSPPAMWGAAIVGFGSRTLRYPDGRDLDWMEIGFSPRKANTTLYLTAGIDAYADLLATLGPHTIGKGCLYLKRLADVDHDVLRAIIDRSLSVARTN